MDQAHIDVLADRAAMAAVGSILDRWLRRDGVAALAAIENVRAAVAGAGLRIPPVLTGGILTGGAPKAGADAPMEWGTGALARALLATLADCDDPEVRAWTGQALANADRARTQSAGAGGDLFVTGLFCAMVLAARSRTGRRGTLWLGPLSNGDIAAIAAIASAMLAAL